MARRCTGFKATAAPWRRAQEIPAALTVAISREAGARGSTIGRRAARILGWPVYDQEMIEYMAQDANGHPGHD